MAAGTLRRSRELFERALRVVPGGIYGHQSPRTLVPDAYPFFFESGEGCRVRDVDGNEYIDYVCSYGPVVLGHRHPAVESAAELQRRKGNCFDGPAPVWVELAERLVALTPFADWVVFAKNGSDVCTWAVQVARAHTRKRKVLKAEGAYHGIDAWCTPFPRGTLPEERAHVSTFRYNDTASLEAAFAESRGDVAALVLTPFRHDTGRDQELPEPGFLAAARRLCDEEDAVLVLDDIRAGFRLGLRGSGEFFGLRPDLSCVSKALANGYPLSACLGSEKLRGAAEGVFFTGSFFTSAVPMAAALACLEVLEKTDAPAHMAAMGRLLLEGLGRQAEAHGLRVRLTGPPALPFLTFPSDRGSFERSRLFCAECVRGGVYFHPYHNWFLSAAHTEEDIRRTLEVTDAAFSAVRRTFGSCPESDTGSIREGTNTRARWT